MATPKDSVPASSSPKKVANFSVVDLTSGAINRQIRTPTATYNDVKYLHLKLQAEYGGKISLEEALVMCVQAGLVALTNNPRAARELP